MYHIICLNCSKEHVAKRNNVKYCSKECRISYNVKYGRKKRTPNCHCSICGKPMYKCKADLKKCKDGKPTCSKKCMSEKRRDIRIRKIEEKIGSLDFKKWLYNKYHNEQKGTHEIAEIVYGKRHFSPNILSWMDIFDISVRSNSDAVALQWKDNEERKRKQVETFVKSMGKGTPARIKLIEKMQTSEYKMKQSISKQGNKNGMYGVKGKHHPQWNPNATKEQRIKERKTDKDREWKINVILRDGRTCASCGDKHSKIVVHHLNSYHWDVENRYNIDNGIVLCESCHKDFHSKYGYKNNTKKQFNEYMKKYSKINNQQLALL